MVGTYICGYCAYQNKCEQLKSWRGGKPKSEGAPRGGQQGSWPLGGRPPDNRRTAVHSTHNTRACVMYSFRYRTEAYILNSATSSSDWVTVLSTNSGSGFVLDAYHICQAMFCSISIMFKMVALRIRPFADAPFCTVYILLFA